MRRRTITQLKRSIGHTICPKVWRTPPCRTRSKLRSESIEHAPCRCWEPPGCPCRWRAAPRQPRCPQRICRCRTPQRATKSLSAKKKSLMSVWRRSMSSTRKMSEHPNPAYNLPDTDTGGAATEAAEAAEAAEAVGEAAAAVVAEAAGGGAIEMLHGKAISGIWWCGGGGGYWCWRNSIRIWCYC